MDYSEYEMLATYLMTHPLEKLYTIMTSPDLKTWNWHDTTRIKTGWSTGMYIPTIDTHDECVQKFREYCSDPAKVAGAKVVRLSKYVAYGGTQPTIVEVIRFREFE